MYKAIACLEYAVILFSDVAVMAMMSKNDSTSIKTNFRSVSKSL